MLKLHTLAEWMHGFLDPERPYGLPEDGYDDVIPSGVLNFDRNDFLLKSVKLQAPARPGRSAPGHFLCQGNTAQFAPDGLSTARRIGT